MALKLFNNAGTNSTILDAQPTANRNIMLPDISGTLALVNNQVFTGSLFLLNGDYGIELGGNSTDKDSFIDFHSTSPIDDYEARILCESSNKKLSIIAPNIGFSVTPTAPTAPAGTKTTQLATTEFAMGAGIGSNQTWQDVTGSRTYGTIYTNTTGKPIEVTIYGNNPNSASDYRIIVNGIIAGINATGTSNWCGVTAIVPNGATYQCLASAGSFNITTWSELR
jgi:hypothetical protein